MNLGLKEYLTEAFGARPWGMFIPPNWVALAGIALGGFINPGIWILGLGMELGYLYLTATSPRFQRLIKAKKLLAARQQWMVQQQQQLTDLSKVDQNRYHLLEERCRGIIDHQKSLDTTPGDLQDQGEGLARLTWIYLRLLLTRQAINRVLGDAIDPESEETLTERITQLSEQVKDTKLSEDIRKSLNGQMEILQQRLEKQKEAREKVVFLTAEMTRIEEQVELIREQAAVSADPKSVSERIDHVAADLSGRSQWLREQQEMYGRVEDLLAEPPPLTMDPPKQGEGAKQ